MDTSDTSIVFNKIGVCNHCINFEKVTKKSWHPNRQGQDILNSLVKKIKAENKKNEYDCIIGLSGGVDSSYLALKVKELDLRPLVVHIDAGWNTELAVNNIEKIVKFCNFELFTHVMNWNEMKDLQYAYFNSGVANQDVPQDHAFFSNLYRFAVQNKIKYVFNGGNISTESIFPSSWHGAALDALSLKAIHKKYGKLKLKDYKTMSFSKYYFWYPFVKKMKVVRPLNYMSYDKKKAICELEKKTGWKPYDGKHGESVFTKFFQDYYLPVRFGFDKRRPHLSSLIVSGQITREKAIKILNEAPYDKDEIQSSIRYFCKKIDISLDEFDKVMSSPLQYYENYPNWNNRYKLIKKIQSFIETIIRKKVNIYS